MFCPACGYENLPGVDFCQECLSSLSHLDTSQSAKTESRIEKAILKEKVYQILSSPSSQVNTDTPLIQVLNIMAEKNSSSVVIINPISKAIEGIFTERSFVRRASLNFPENKDLSIDNFMAKNPILLKSTDKTVIALHSMFVAGYSYAIIDEDPPRILSIKNILQYVIELYPSLAGFDKLLEELNVIANEDGVISDDEQKILDKVEENKEQFLRIFARIDSSGKLREEDREMLEDMIDEFIPSIEEIADSDHPISSDEAALLRKLVNYFDENKDRLIA